VGVFSKVLVANRGEIAVRIFRTLRELGIPSVAVYSDADRDAVHVRQADEAYAIGPGPATQSYLVHERIIDVARRAGAEAIHPGYGFLAENASFARAVDAAGLVWIGPAPCAIELMGSKTRARDAMRAGGVPIVPGTLEPVTSVAEVARVADDIGWPIAIKAAAGGGGKGLKLVRSPAEVERALEAAKREGEAYFSDATVYVERYLEDPRHIEVQVLADQQGGVIHLGERDCTIQRRHQKLVEETPSPAVDDELRARLGKIAVTATRAAGYSSAGTIEGLLTREGDYFFLEMNTRIQVEHTITEMVTGLDLVREQILIAAGRPLSLRQEDVRHSGHAIECRINAEDASNGFLPSPGLITSYHEPGGPGVRVDSGVELGSEVSGLYDPLIAKLIVHGVDREHARARMLRALDEYEIGGVTTLLGFHRALLRHPCFAEGGTCNGIVESEALRLTSARERGATRATWPEVGRPSQGTATVVELDGRRFDVRVLAQEPPYSYLARGRKERASERAAWSTGRGAVVSPMQGTVLDVRVREGDLVRPGQVICIVEAMKMENEIGAHHDGRVAELSIEPGQPIKTGQVICVLIGEEVR
jgi:acetyl-CoA/propionyl-CoA/long-chain acyl-CoA carboxylase, biotin carboxylase, biotin carboxyl carrier protein